MAYWVKQSTATTLALGPFVDSTDGVTAETGLTISQADIRLSKNGGAFAQTNNAAGATHMENGYYSVPLDTTDTNTLGRLKVCVNESGALPVWMDLHVAPANVWDSLFGADKLEVDVLQFGGTNGTNSSGRPEVNVTHAAGTAWASGAITAASIASDAITAAKIASDAITAAKIADGAIDAATFAAGAINAAAIAADAITAAKVAADVTTEIQSGLATAAALDAVDNFVDTEIAAIKTVVDAIQAKTDNLPSDPADASVIAGLIAATEAKVDTVDTVVDAIKAKTDGLTFTVANVLDANIQRVNDVVVNGDGQPGTEWGP